MIGPDEDSDAVRPAPALVVFTDAREIPWLRLLRPGFRHVLVALRLPGGGWIVVNPLSHQIRIDSVATLEGPALAHWFRAQGFTVVETMTRRAPRREAPWAPMTCVEVVKRLLGIHARWVWTPWALYRLLVRDALEYPGPIWFGGRARRLVHWSGPQPDRTDRAGSRGSARKAGSRKPAGLPALLGRDR